MNKNSLGKELHDSSSLSTIDTSVRIDSYSHNQDSRIAEPAIGTIHNAIVLTNSYQYTKNNAPLTKSFLLGFIPNKEVEIPMNTAIGSMLGITPGKLNPFNLALAIKPRSSQIVGKYFCSDTVHEIADGLDKSDIEQFKATLESLHWIIDRKASPEDTLRSTAYRYSLNKDHLESIVNQHLQALQPERIPSPIY